MSRKDKFIRKSYQDGDVDYVPPRWRKALDNYNRENVRIDFDETDSKDYYIKEDEIALKHPELGSIVKLTDDGFIDIFAGKELGIRLDPKTNSINIFADNINLIGKGVNVKSKPNSFTWNGHSFNSDLYYEDDRVKDLHLKGSRKEWVHKEGIGWHWEEKEVAIKPMKKDDSRIRYSDGMIGILKGLGLPVNDNE